MSLEVADEEQSKLVSKLSDIARGKIPVEKRSFLNNVVLFLSGREKILNNFRSNIFSTKKLDKTLTPELTPDPTPKHTKHLSTI